MRNIISYGKCSAAFATIIMVAYNLLLILYRLEIIPHPGNLYWFFFPSVLLAPVFLIITVCLDVVAPEQSRKWTTAAWVMATINCTMFLMIYGVQTGMLSPSHFNWQTGDMGAQVFQQHTILVKLKYAGCFLISASTFICAFAFRNCNSRWFFRSLIFSAIPLPALIISYIYPQYYYIATIGLVTFPLATFQATRFFQLEERKLKKKEKRIKHPLEWAT